MKDLLDGIVQKKTNPCKELWRDFMDEVITGDELRKILREEKLKNIEKYKHLDHPPRPTKKNKITMENWGKAYNHIECENTHHRYWLGVLLRDLGERKLETDVGTKERIKELLAGFRK